MNTKSQLWLDAYLKHRQQHPIALDTPQWRSIGITDAQIAQFRSTRQPFYLTLLYSGLIYGFPVHYPFTPSDEIPESGLRKIKMTLLDIMIQSILPELEGDSVAEAIGVAGQQIKRYYQLLDLAVGEGKSDSVEGILLERVAFKKSLLDFRKTGVNSHLFWDCYFFRIWQKRVRNGEDETKVLGDLIDRKRAMKMLTLKVLTAAVHCDGRVRKGEKVLHNHFKRSSKLLTKGQKAQAKRIIADGISIDDFKIPFISDWTARRYLLDIAVLAASADKELTETEQEFLTKLCRVLRLTPVDLIESKADLSCFLLQYGPKLHFYSNRKSSFSLLSQAITENARKFAYATNMEYSETKDMALTIGALLKNQIGDRNPDALPSEEEIIHAFDQLKDIPRFLPFLSMIFIPVPGITELYILLAYNIERMTGDTVQLLPSQFSKMVKKK